MKITSKNLYSLVVDEINKRATTKQQQIQVGGSRSTLDVLAMAGASASSKEILSAVFQILEETIPSNILSGLEVKATSPVSDQITISSGRGVSGGRVYELAEDVTITVPLTGNVWVWYVNLYSDKISVDSSRDIARVLTIAKIVVPSPGITSRVIDKSDDSLDAYIQSYKEYKFYGFNDKFEEDTVELLRDNIGEILADNLIGNIRLSEDLKITNTQGTLEINSDSLKLYDTDLNNLAKFNRHGVYFYDIVGRELSRFTSSDARIGNINILPNSIQSGNFVSGSSGFRIQDTGNAEFNSVTVRGTIYATLGEIGGWTIGSNELYATTTGTIKTSANAGSGYDGVVLDKDGLRVYDALLGLVVNLPSDGSAPSFASGVIQNTIFEINTNAILRTSETVGDGSASSAGILINNTGVYGCGANQTLVEANFRILANGNTYFSGEINATSGNIGDITLVDGSLSGGLLVGSLIRGAAIETSDTVPRIRIDESGIYYQLTTSVGTYGLSESGGTGFLYGDGTVYGTGATAFLFNENFPVLAITSELLDTADIRLYNRGADPTGGVHELGDLIVTDAILKICATAGSPGIFEFITQSTGTTGGTGSAGSGNQYVELNVGGTVYKILHDGTV